MIYTKTKDYFTYSLKLSARKVTLIVASLVLLLTITACSNLTDIFSPSSNRFYVIYALDRESGQELWQVRTSQNSTTDFAGTGPIVYLEPGSQRIVGISRDGKETWQAQARSDFPPVIDNGVAYGGWLRHPWPFSSSWKLELYAVNTATGAVIWEKKFVAPISFSTPGFDDMTPWPKLECSGVIGDAVVFMVDGNPNYLFALDRTTGERKWDSDFLNGWGGSYQDVHVLLPEEDMVLVSPYDGLYALASDTGGKLWETSQQPVRDGTNLCKWDNILLLAENNHLYGWDISTGEEIWSYGPLSDTMSRYHFVLDDALAIVHQDGKVQVIDVSDGKLSASYTIPGHSYGKNADYLLIDRDAPLLDYYFHPVLNNGVLCYAGENNMVHGVDIRTGRPRWKRDAGFPVTGNLFVNHGVLLLFNPDRSRQVIDVQSGNMVWKSDSGSNWGYSLIEESTIYLAWQDRARKIDHTTGSVTWESLIGSPEDSINRMYTENTSLFIGRNNNEHHVYYSVDAETGEKKWEYTVPLDARGTTRLWSSEIEVAGEGPVFIRARYLPAKSTTIPPARTQTLREMMYGDTQQIE